MMFNKTPAGSGQCYGCEKREVGCHARCEEYKAYKAQIAKEKQLRHKDREFEDYVFESKKRIFKKMKGGI